MIEIESRELADIPVLHAYPVGQKDTPLPCVIFYHGFTSSSLVYSYFAVALAQAGLRVIMPDAPDHGSRFSGDAARRLNQFWQILLQSMQEFTTLRAAIAEENTENSVSFTISDRSCISIPKRVSGLSVWQSVARRWAR